MEWVEGQTLNRFVEESLEKPKMLRQLLELWPKLAGRLREAGIAHADLQHGNVLLGAHARRQIGPEADRLRRDVRAGLGGARSRASWATPTISTRSGCGKASTTPTWTASRTWRSTLRCNAW